MGSMGFENRHKLAQMSKLWQTYSVWSIEMLAVVAYNWAYLGLLQVFSTPNVN